MYIYIYNIKSCIYVAVDLQHSISPPFLLGGTNFSPKFLKGGSENNECLEGLKESLHKYLPWGAYYVSCQRFCKMKYDFEDSIWLV